MTNLHAKSDIAARIRAIQEGLHADVAAMTADQFEHVTGDEWSAADYLKHLILSIKPFARSMQLPSEKVRGLWGTPERPSLSYDELVGLYTQRIADGIRAEDFAPVTPVEYRFAPDTTDSKAALLTAWNEGNDRLIAALNAIDDVALDTHQIPHPAIGLITFREMLYFTIHHNTLHWRDIQRVGG